MVEEQAQERDDKNPCPVCDTQMVHKGPATEFAGLLPEEYHEWQCPACGQRLWFPAPAKASDGPA